MQQQMNVNECLTVNPEKNMNSGKTSINIQLNV